MVFIYCDINSAVKFYQYARHYQENNKLSYKTCYLCAVFDKNLMLCVISFKNCTNSAVLGFIYHVCWTMSLYNHRNAQKLPLLLLFSQLCSFFLLRSHALDNTCLFQFPVSCPSASCLLNATCQTYCDYVRVILHECRCTVKMLKTFQMLTLLVVKSIITHTSSGLKLSKRKHGKNKQ